MFRVSVDDILKKFGVSFNEMNRKFYIKEYGVTAIIDYDYFPYVIHDKYSGRLYVEIDYEEEIEKVIRGIEEMVLETKAKMKEIASDVENFQQDTEDEEEE